MRGYARELYENLTYDESNKNILFKDVPIFIRDLTGNNLVMTNRDISILQEFKRLVGRVIVETDENRKVNEEEAKRICLFLASIYNELTVENVLDWDSSADLFANTLDTTVIEVEVDPIAYS